MNGKAALSVAVLTLAFLGCSRPPGERGPADEDRAAAAGSGVAKNGAYVFEGRKVTLPVIVRKARAAAVTYVVDAGAARALIPSPELEIVEVGPRKTLFTLGVIDYQRLVGEPRVVLGLVRPQIPDGGRAGGHGASILVGPPAE